MKEPKLPGVTLFHIGSRRYQAGGKSKVEMKLEGTIEDETIWVEVEKMFVNGFRVYTQEDFKGELVNVFRTEVLQLERRIEIAEFEKGRLELENKLLREELGKKTEILDGFSRSLRG
jgi:hypothetical protein